MIAETSAFLTWALREDISLPRIPRKRVSEGGFRHLLAQPGVRGRLDHWWNCVLSKVSG